MFGQEQHRFSRKDAKMPRGPFDCNLVTTGCNFAFLVGVFAYGDIGKERELAAEVWRKLFFNGQILAGNHG